MNYSSASLLYPMRPYHRRIGTQGIGNSIGILVTNLDTLILAMLVVDILTKLDDIHVTLAVKHMFGVQTERETTEI